MDDPTANQFMISLVKSLQALCNGCIEFSSSVEVIGHIHLNIDRKVILNYVLTEEVSKSASEDATLFSSHSYHSKPPHSQDCADSVDRAPSPPRGSSSSTGTNSRRKTHHVPRVDDSESFSFTTVPQPISASQTKTNSVASKLSRDISHISNFRHSTNPDVQKPVASSASDSQDRRRKSSECLFQTSGMKHRCWDEVKIKTEPEIISIKEEVASDDETMVEALSGQDMAAPDFSNIMVESLDHADQNEVSSLVTGNCAQTMQPVETTGDSVQQIQLQPYPVMLHAISKSPVLSGPSTSTQPVPSTSTDAGADSSQGNSGPVFVETYVQTPYTAVDVVCKNKKRRRPPPKLAAKSKKLEEAVQPHLPSSVEKSKYLEYTLEDIAEAIELVHGGMPVIDAALKYGIPRATLFNRSREGCKTHSGRCSEVFLRTHVGEDYPKKRVKSQYTAETMEKAIEAVHRGMPVIDAAIRYDIPRASLFIRSGRGCPSHLGRCSTVSSDGKLKRTKVSRFRYLQIMQEKQTLKPSKQGAHALKDNVRKRVAAKASQSAKAPHSVKASSSFPSSSAKSSMPVELNPQVKLTKIPNISPERPVAKLVNVVIHQVAPENEPAPDTPIQDTATLPAAAAEAAAAPIEVVFETNTAPVSEGTLSELPEVVVESDLPQAPLFETLSGPIVVKIESQVEEVE